MLVATKIRDYIPLLKQTIAEARPSLFVKQHEVCSNEDDANMQSFHPDTTRLSCFDYDK